MSLGIKLFLIALILTGCATTTTQFDLPIPSDDRAQVVEVLYKGDPILLRPHSADEYFFAGLLYDCLLFFCIPITTIVGGTLDLPSELPATVEQAKKTLEIAEIETQLNDLLIERIIATGEELTAYHFVAPGQTDAPQNPDYVELTVSAKSVGISPALKNYVFSLTIQGLIGYQKTVPIEYKSQEQEIAYWIGDDGTNLQSSILEAINNVAEELVRTIFLPSTQQEESIN